MSHHSGAAELGRLMSSKRRRTKGDGREYGMCASILPHERCIRGRLDALTQKTRIQIFRVLRTCAGNTYVVVAD